jgi:hypothetical protein
MQERDATEVARITISDSSECVEIARRARQAAGISNEVARGLPAQLLHMTGECELHITFNTIAPFLVALHVSDSTSSRGRHVQMISSNSIVSRLYQPHFEPIMNNVIRIFS